MKARAMIPILFLLLPGPANANDGAMPFQAGAFDGDDLSVVRIEFFAREAWFEEHRAVNSVDDGGVQHRASVDEPRNSHLVDVHWRGEQGPRQRLVHVGFYGNGSAFLEDGRDAEWTRTTLESLVEQNEATGATWEEDVQQPCRIKGSKLEVVLRGDFSFSLFGLYLENRQPEAEGEPRSIHTGVQRSVETNPPRDSASMVSHLFGRLEGAEVRLELEAVEGGVYVNDEVCQGWASLLPDEPQESGSLSLELNRPNTPSTHRGSAPGGADERGVLDSAVFRESWHTSPWVLLTGTVLVAYAVMAYKAIFESERLAGRMHVHLEFGRLRRVRLTAWWLSLHGRGTVETHWLRARALLALGKAARARRILEPLHSVAEDESVRSSLAFQIAETHAHQGHGRLAADWLCMAMVGEPTCLRQAQASSHMLRVSGDPEFSTRIGMAFGSSA